MRKRRGLSSIVGMAFAMIALSTVLVYVNYSLTTLDQYGQSIMNKSYQTLNQGLEKFQVTGVNVVGSKLNITVANTGTVPINFAKIWVQNSTALNGHLDWAASYVPSKALVSPGATLTNIGYNTPLSINPANAYYVKLVTSRGNSQAFTVNSPNVAPLNIQLLALPSTVPSGFTTELVMIVTNNGSSTLVNLVPQATLTANTATCKLGTVSPLSYNTLPPGGTAVFKWDLTVTGNNNQYCAFTGQLQNGYTGNTASATVTVTQVPLASSNYAPYAGLLTINYTTFQWTQGTQWNKGWTIPVSKPTVFSIKMTNNNATGDLYISQQSFFWFTSIANGNGNNNVKFYIVNATTLSPLGITKYSCGSPNDYCIMVPHGGGTVTILFGDSGPESGSIQSMGSANPYDGFILMYGKFATSRSGSGTPYGQNIPYIAILAQ